MIPPFSQQIGMFAYTGLKPEQMEKLTREVRVSLLSVLFSLPYPSYRVATMDQPHTIYETLVTSLD